MVADTPELAPRYQAVLNAIRQHFSTAEYHALSSLKEEALTHYLNLGKAYDFSVISNTLIHLEPDASDPPPETGTADGKATPRGNRFRRIYEFREAAERDNFTLASRDQIIEALKEVNNTVMFGAGKDSSFVLTMARTLQLQLLEEYGETFKLRVAIGRHPGMLDLMDEDHNIENVLKALDLKDDPLAEIFFIDHQTVLPYQPGFPLSESMVNLNRDNVLLNGHMAAGAGRRTFCDDCNKNLSGWIATALAHDGGSDLYMTGDASFELKQQIGTDVPRMAEELQIAPSRPDRNLSATQQSLRLLAEVGDKHSQIVHQDEQAIAQRHIPYENIPERTRNIATFDHIAYDSNERMPFFKDFLNFRFDDLMFSFTETDCGNPALMCHNYGLIAELWGGTYYDGVRAYRDEAIAKMFTKGFHQELIDIMLERYGSDEKIDEWRGRVERYAERAYHLTPSHLEAMVYSPFTMYGVNLDKYLNHLVETGAEQAHTLKFKADDIRKTIVQPKGEQPVLEPALLEALEKHTGLSLDQMRHLCRSPLVDHFRQKPGTSQPYDFSGEERDYIKTMMTEYGRMQEDVALASVDKLVNTSRLYQTMHKHDSLYSMALTFRDKSGQTISGTGSGR